VRHRVGRLLHLRFCDHAANLWVAKNQWHRRLGRYAGSTNLEVLSERMKKSVSARVRRNEETVLRQSGPESLGLGTSASRRFYQLGEKVL
jgi:hypothetical protein